MNPQNKQKFDPKETLYRTFDLSRDIKEDSRTVELSWCSEEPVERYFGNEILSVEAKAVRMGRLNDGAPFLWMHSAEKQIGVVESARLCDDKKGRALVRFSKSAFGEEKFQDVKDGILRKVSVGYRVHSMVLESERDGLETYRVNDWEPFEISLVSVPADTTVGVGRGIEISTTGKKEKIMETQTIDVNSVRKGEIDRIREIDALCSRFNVPAERREKALTNGEAVDSVRDWILTSHLKAEPVKVDPNIGMTKKEKRRYSLLRAISCLADNRPLDGLEREASDETARVLKRQPSGFFIPHDMACDEDKEMARALRAMSMNRGLLATTATAGGYAVQTDVLGGSMIELLRNKQTLVGLGVKTMSGLVGNIAIPRHTGSATAYWLAEGATVTASTQAFQQLGATPKTLIAQTAFTKQFLAQSSIDAEAFVRDDLMTVLAIAKDLAGIQGSGGAEPLGIVNTTGIGTVTFGAAPTWAKVVEFETTMDTANALGGSIAFLTTPAVKGKWKTTVKASGQPIFLCEDNLANGYPLVSTNQISTAGQVIFANFADMMFFDWAGMDLTIDPYTLASSKQIALTLSLMTDFGVRHAASVVKSTDSGAQ